MKGEFTMIKSTKTDFARLRRQTENDIDYSDIPETSESFWGDSSLVVPHQKVEFTVNIDEDLALWLKRMGKNSDLAINNILRAYYLVNF